MIVRRDRPGRRTCWRKAAAIQAWPADPPNPKVRKSSGQGAGEIRAVIVDDALPDTDGVEFRVPLRAGPQLLLHDLEIDLTELVAVQADALVGEEVRRGPENPHLVVVGQDSD